MRNITNGILMIGLFLVTISCTKDLRLEPVSSISASSFWETPSQAKAGVLGMMKSFRTQATRNLFIWGGARGGTLTFGLQASQGRERYFQNTINAENPGPDWTGLYKTIFATNLAIAKVPNIEFSNKSEKNRLLARAYTMRAYVYFVMARTWGGVPLITQLIPANERNKGRPEADIGKVFKRIKQDVNKAIDLFPDNSLPGCRCKWSKPAAEALKGDVYLWTGKKLDGGKKDFQTALSALQNVQKANVGLLDNFDDIFRYDNKGNKEIIMAVHFEKNESNPMYGNGLYIRSDQIPAEASKRVKKMIGLGGGLNRWGPSEYLRKQFTNDDSRKNATYLDIYKYTNNGQDSTYYASIVRKFRGIVDNGQRKFLDDVVLYRYGGVLLMIAEAKNALRMDPSVEINAVRKRAYGPYFHSHHHEFTSMSQKANKKAILEERLKELAFEGKRWWSIVEFGKAFDLVPSLENKDKQSNKYLLLWPISLNLLSLNNKINQNPGY